MPMRCLIVLAALFFVSLETRSQSYGGQNESDQAHRTLKGLGDSLTRIADSVEQHEIGRILFLNSLVDALQTQLSTKGLGHAGTFRAYQTLVISVRHSKNYLESVGTPISRADIANVHRIIADIVKVRGIDEAASLITHSVFVQLEKVIRELVKNNPQPELSATVADFIPEIGQLVALSMKGDWADVYDLSRPLSLRLRDLYPLLNSIKSKDPAFSSVQSFRGLVDFYIDFARSEKVRDPK